MIFIAYILPFESLLTRSSFLTFINTREPPDPDRPSHLKIVHRHALSEISGNELHHQVELPRVAQPRDPFLCSSQQVVHSCVVRTLRLKHNLLVFLQKEMVEMEVFSLQNGVDLAVEPPDVEVGVLLVPLDDDPSGLRGAYLSAV